MRTLTLGLGALVCTFAILAITVNSATAEPRGHRDWNKAEQSGWRDGHRAYGYRPYDGPSVYYGAYYYDPYYYPPYPYYYAPAPYFGSSVSLSFGFSALRGTAMSLGTILIIILILVLLGVFPTWGHSRGWGYGPSGIVGLILIVVIILALLGRL